jgi:hypothetical protein
VQKLHLVGFTPERDGLILSVRKGAKSGKYVVAVDEDVLRQLGEVARTTPMPPAARKNGLRPQAGPRTTRPESELTPREMQELLRAGWTVEEVAAEAGVDVDWVSRFASPVLAEMHRILEQALSKTLDKSRVGPSALPLASSVRRNAAERGVRFTEEDFESCWRAFQLDELTWVVGFDYESRGRNQTAEWILDLETDELAPRNRLAGQLGHVVSARRRIDTSAPAKPKAKTKAKATAKPASRPRGGRPAPAKAAAKKKRKAATPAKKKPARPRAAGPAPDAPPAAAPAARPHDPYRDQLRSRQADVVPARPAERAAPAIDAPLTTPPRFRATHRRSEPELEREPDLELEPPEPARKPEPARAVALLVPSVRALDRQPPHRGRAPGASPTIGNHGPLPAPEPVAVPEAIRERVATPLGSLEPLDDEPEDLEPVDDQDDELEDELEIVEDQDDELEVVEEHDDDLLDEHEPDDDVAELFAEALDDDLAELELVVPEPPRPRPMPPSPTFRGAQAAGPVSAAPAPRRRRSEPLRAR